MSLKRRMTVCSSLNWIRVIFDNLINDIICIYSVCIIHNIIYCVLYTYNILVNRYWISNRLGIGTNIFVFSMQVYDTVIQWYVRSRLDRFVTFGTYITFVGSPQTTIYRQKLVYKAVIFVKDVNLVCSIIECKITIYSTSSK